MKILVVDDDLELRHLISYTLRQAGYLIVEAEDGPEAIATAGTERPDLMILDANLPRMNGFEVLRRLRASAERIPVMMLTVRSSEEDQVRGLDLGADDYLTKPFSPRTLLARVRALLRRRGEEAPAPLSAGDFLLDVEAQSVRVRQGAPTRLTKQEFRLLQLLLANAGRVLPPDRLLSHIWGYRGVGDRNLLKQLVHRLRQKIERDPAAPRYLVTVSGVGYSLHPAGE